MEVPQSPQSSDNVPTAPRPSGAYVMMAAATMFKNGNLTEEQRAGASQAGGVQSHSETAGDLDVDAVHGFPTPDQRKARKEAGDELTQSLLSTGEIGRIGQKFTAEGKRRSENVEDVRQSSLADKYQREADVAMQKVQGKPAINAALTSMMGKKAQSEMARQLGYEDVEPAANRIAARRAATIMRVRGP